MKLYIKILTSIPSILSILSIIDMWTIEIMWNTFPSMDAFNSQLISILVLALFAWAYLIQRLWSYKQIPISTKMTWALVMIFVFSQITTLFYIWAKDEQLSNENKKLELSKESSSA